MRIRKQSLLLFTEMFFFFFFKEKENYFYYYYLFIYFFFFFFFKALEDFVSMVETQLFPKLISLNTQHFDFDSCNFSEKQMAAIDRFEYRSKEGSARV